MTSDQQNKYGILGARDAELQDAIVNYATADAARAAAQTAFDNRKAQLDAAVLAARAADSALEAAFVMPSGYTPPA
jgi:hypothetical protein